MNNRPYEISIWDDVLAYEVEHVVQNSEEGAAATNAPGTTINGSEYIIDMTKNAGVLSYEKNETGTQLVYDTTEHTASKDAITDEYKVVTCNTKEKKIGIIGSNSMTAQHRALNGKLVENVNGSRTLTFSMYYKYYDNETGERVENPFVKLLTNERKVKLRLGNPGDADVEWYDFIIKDIQENSESMMFSYTCTDLFINELSKTGFTITLDAELENNIGTPKELAEYVLQGSGWKVNEGDLIHTFHEEPVYRLTITNGSVNLSPVVAKSGDQTAYTLSAKSDAPIKLLAFYSSINAKDTTIQVLCPIDNGGKPITGKVKSDDKWDMDETGIVVNSEHSMSPTVGQFLIDGVTYNENGLPSIAGATCVLAKNIRGRRIVRKQETKYDANLEKYVSRYSKIVGDGVELETDGTPVPYWCFTDSGKNQITVLNNYVTNSKNFKDDSGWEPMAMVLPDTSPVSFISNYTSGLITEDEAGEILNDENGSLVSSWIKMDLSSVSVGNTGLWDYLYDYDKISAGDVFILMTKYHNVTLNDLDTVLNYSPATSVPTHSIRLYNRKWDTIEREFFAKRLTDSEIACITKNGGIDASEWNFYKFEFNKDITHDELIKKEFRLSFSGDGIYYLNEIKLFKRVMFYQPSQNEEGSLDVVFDESRANLYLLPGDYADQPIVFPEYHVYRKNYSNEKDINSMTYALTTKDITVLEESYKPYYDPYSAARVQITAKESNRFNILQDIAENAECWVRFDIKHNAYTGRVELDSENKPIKTVTFYQFAGKENFAGFKYGINLKSIQRTIESNQLASKLIVKPNSNEFAEAKQCAIGKAKSNPTKEDIIYNFDYYINHGMIPYTAWMDDMYGDDETGDTICYQKRMRKIVENLDEITSKYTYYSRLIDKLESECTVYKEALESAVGERDNVLESIYSYNNVYSYNDYKQLVNSDTMNISSEETISQIVVGEEIHFDQPIPTIPNSTDITMSYGYVVSGITTQQIHSVTINTNGTSGASFCIYDNKLYAVGNSYDKITIKISGSKVYTGSDKPKTIQGLLNFITKNQFILPKYSIESYFAHYVGKEMIKIDTLTERIINYEKVLGTTDKPGMLADLESKKEEYLKIKEELKRIRNEKTALENELYERYHRFVQEGTWISEDYYDNELYYLEACNVSQVSAFPKTSYTINVIDVSRVEGYTNINFKVGEKSFIQDTEFFGWTNVYDENGTPHKTPYQEEVICSEVVRMLDDASQNTIRVQNYKNQFQDLFQRINATTQSVQYKSGEYQKAANAFTSGGELKNGILNSALERNDAILQNATNETVNWGSDGITTINGNQPNLITRIVGGAVMVSNDKGTTWGHAITGEGINANYLTAGTIDASMINIRAGDGIAFGWNATGLNAYQSEYIDAIGAIIKDGNFDTSTFIRFDQFGIYGVKDKAEFAPVGMEYNGITGEDRIGLNNPYTPFGLTWKGFFFRTGEVGNGVTIDSINDLCVVKDKKIRVKIGRIDNEYGIAIYNDDEEPVISQDSSGKLKVVGDITATNLTIGENAEISGTIKANTGNIGGWEIKENGLLSINGTFLGKVGMSSDSTYPAFWAGYEGTINGGPKDESGRDSTKFYVTHGGYLHASDANIIGVITATEGEIGGWKIGTTALMSKESSTSYGKVGMSSNTERPAFWAGYNGSTNGGPTDTPELDSTKFYVSHDGHMHSTSGDIGGWNITSSCIDSSSGKKSLILASASDATDKWINATDSKGKNTFSVFKSGKLYASGADIEGVLTANSGSKIGPFIVENNRIYINDYGQSQFGSGIFCTMSDYAGIEVNAEVGNSGKLFWVYSSRVTHGENEYEHCGIEVDPIVSKGGIKLYFKETNLKVISNAIIMGNDETNLQITPITNGQRIQIRTLGTYVDGTKTYYKGLNLSVDNSFNDLRGNWQLNGSLSGMRIDNTSNTKRILITPDPDSKEGFNIGKTGGYGDLLGEWWCNNAKINNSDVRLKNSIQQMDDRYNLLFDNLNPVIFKYNDGQSDRYHTGFIAQEALQATKIANLTTQDFAAVCSRDVNDENAYMGIRYEEFVSLNTWQIQKLKSRVSELEAKIAQLEAKI